MLEKSFEEYNKLYINLFIQLIFINTQYFLTFYSSIPDIHFIVYLVYSSLAYSESIAKIHPNTKKVSILVGNA